MNDNVTYICAIKGPPAGHDHKTYFTSLTHRQIISLARDEAGMSGESLESFAGIPIIETFPNEFDYERMLEGDELFEVALRWQRRDGRQFYAVGTGQ